MTGRKKLLDAIRNNPKSVRFEDACKAAEMAGEAVILNFQDRKGWMNLQTAIITAFPCGEHGAVLRAAQQKGDGQNLR